MIIHSKSPIGEKALQEKTAALVGLSIRNSYFKEDNLKELITWAKDSFARVFLMLPDVPAISTLRSLGYEENKAQATATLASNNLENKSQRIIETVNVAGHVQVIRWKDIVDNKEYQNMLQQLKALYDANESFRKDIRETTVGVLKNNETTLPLEEAVDIGVDFIIQELACILNAADIFGVPTCAYVYHREMPIHVKVLNREYPFVPPQNTGYIIAQTDFSLRREPGFT